MKVIVSFSASFTIPCISILVIYVSPHVIEKKKLGILDEPQIFFFTELKIARRSQQVFFFFFFSVQTM